MVIVYHFVNLQHLKQMNALQKNPRNDQYSRIGKQSHFYDNAASLSNDNKHYCNHKPISERP